MKMQGKLTGTVRATFRRPLGGRAKRPAEPGGGDLDLGWPSSSAGTLRPAGIGMGGGERWREPSR
jgi:hypothetical protein